MAQDDEIIKISVQTNAAQAAQETNKLATSLNNVDEGAAQASGAMKSLDSTFEQVYGDLKPLTARMGEAEDRLYELALAGQTATEEYRQLLTVVATYRRTQVETDRVVDAASTTLGQKLGGAAQIAATSVSFATSGMALFGSQSEETEKALLKVQAAMAFADSVTSLIDLKEQFGAFKDLVVSGYARIVAAKQAEIAATAEATVAQRILNATALSNPYVALAAAIAVISVVTYAWIKSSEKEEIALKKATAAVEKNILETDKLAESIEASGKYVDAYNTLEIARARALGSTDDQINKLIASQKKLASSGAIEASAQAYENLLKAQKATSDAYKTGDDDLIKKALENSKKAADIYKNQQDKVTQAFNDEELTRLNVQADAVKKQQDADKAAADKRLAAQKDASDKRLEALKAEIERITALTNEKNSAEDKLLKENQDLTDKTDQQKLDRQKERAEEEIELLRQKGIDTENLTRLNDEKFLQLQADLNQKTKKERDKALLDEYMADADAAIKKTDDQKAKDKILTDAKKENYERIDAMQDSFLKNAAAGVIKNKGIQKAALVVDGAVTVGKIAANTAEAISKDSTKGFPFSVPLVALDIATGALSAASAIQGTNKALQALGGGSVSGAGSQPVAGAAPPSVAFNNTAENQIGNSVAGAQAQQPPLQVYVAESDITTAQSNVKVLVEKNTFG